MPMRNLLPPKKTFKVLCDESRAAGKEVYANGEEFFWNGYANDGFEKVYESKTDAGAPCVYPFAPRSFRQSAAKYTDGAQFIYRSDVKGQPVTFRANDDWARLELSMGSIENRLHVELRDVKLDFPKAVQAMGALWVKAGGDIQDTNALLTVVMKRVDISGGKNALFSTGGPIMLYAEDSSFHGNVGENVDQEHAVYINGVLSTHFVRTYVGGQNAGQGAGHQLKEKGYLRVYEDVTLSNAPEYGNASDRPLNDTALVGFSWVDGLKIDRRKPTTGATPRNTLVDVRTNNYVRLEESPWKTYQSNAWTMPMAPGEPIPAGLLDKVFVHKFANVQVESFRTEPYVFMPGVMPTDWAAYRDGGDYSENREDPRKQRVIYLADDVSGDFEDVFADQGYHYVNPKMPSDAGWMNKKDSFIRHALGLLGR